MAISEKIVLKPVYPIIEGLLKDKSISSELMGKGFVQLNHINQSLFTWQSLLDKGCPLVKKRVLFDLPEDKNNCLAISLLDRWIPQEKKETIGLDLQEIFVSRYTLDDSYKKLNNSYS